MSDATTQSPPVRLRRDGPVAVLTLSRPERRNPLSLDTMRALTAALGEAGADPEVRGVALGAEGPVFSAGHDLRELADADAAAREEVFEACAELMLTVHRLPVPVIAAVRGLATAAGCQLVAACDLAVASEGARFATPGVRIGLFCTTPAVEVARAVGRGRAMRMLLTGEPIDARTALDWGLVSAIVQDDRVDEEARALVDTIARASRDTVALGKRAVGENLGLPLDEAYRHATGVMCDNAGRPDAREGIAAFLGKREPVWTHGRGGSEG